MELIKINNFQIYKNKNSDRILEIKFNNDIIKNLIKIFKTFDLTELEYKPFSRFTIAKKLDDLSDNKLSKYLSKIVKDRNSGCFIFGPQNFSKEIDDKFLTKLSTSLSHLIGLPNFDSMAGKFYARFHVKHEDKSDSYLRKAYIDMDLHTDGTYVKEVTDWLLMSKIEEKNVVGGETKMLHLDDWEYCEEILKDPMSKQDLLWGSPKSKNIDYKVKHPVFNFDKKGRAQISYIDQFPEPKNMSQGIFLQKLSNKLEGSKKKITIKLPVGSTIVANNHFWLHGRIAFKKNKKLSRELLRIRGSFFK
tara:strand:- start:46 stop:960 length:915 start_codon:yes stop_codon:yes gene_type:complete